jgi:hypothetical protein
MGSNPNGFMISNELIQDDKNDDGIIPRMIDALFAAIEKKKETNNVSLKVSFLELYNEEIRDMLNPPSASSGLTIRENSDNEV